MALDKVSFETYTCALYLHINGAEIKGYYLGINCNVWYLYKDFLVVDSYYDITLAKYDLINIYYKGLGS